MKVRLDQLAVLRGLAAGREEAKRMIMAGQIRLADPAAAGAGAAKPGKMIDEGARLEFVGERNPYVSRGGIKLAAAMDRFGIAPTAGFRAMDVGASTGGFTDCLLRRGAGDVVAVDTGRGKIHERLRGDPRVKLLENFNVRRLDLAAIGGAPVDLVAVDVSFISLRLVLPALAGALRAGGEALLLVKPQFEAGRGRIGSGGIVRDPEVRREVLESLIARCREAGWEPMGTMASPILGAKGNAEFFLWLRRGAQEGRAPAPPPELGVDDALREASALREDRRR